ncbi:hypothetical protein [Bartonella pachyuromydis]|uniref:Stability/partitioning determinant n=1 Tax=Bartonella pachyuromydis TaxID=931097 RepID=A0ABP8VL69_9HYPH
MVKERKATFSNLNNLSDVEPTTQALKRNKEEIDKIAQQSGFTTRHASFDSSKEPISAQSSHIDGRFKRRSVKTSRITMTVRPDIDEKFRALAEELTPDGEDLLTFGDVLRILIDFYYNNKKN